MREEAEHVIQNYHLSLIKKLYTLEIYESEELILILSGIGKVQASIAASYACTHFDFSLCINIGIAGNLRWNKYKVWDVFVLSEVFQHDIYLPFWGSHLDYAKQSIMLTNHELGGGYSWDFSYYPNARCLTWDQFIDDSETIEKLQQSYDADIVEMEVFALASVLREYGLLDKLISLKAISDGADSDASEAHMNNLDFAMRNNLEVLDMYLRKIIRK